MTLPVQFYITAGILDFLILALATGYPFLCFMERQYTETQIFRELSI